MENSKEDYGYLNSNLLSKDNSLFCLLSYHFVSLIRLRKLEEILA